MDCLELTVLEKLLPDNILATAYPRRGQHKAAKAEQKHNKKQPVPMLQSPPRQDGTNDEETDLRSTLRGMEAKMETVTENLTRINTQFRYSIALLEDLAVRVQRVEAHDCGKRTVQPATAHGTTTVVPLQPRPAPQAERAQSPQPNSSGIPATLKCCMFCGGHHKVPDCDRFTTLTARKNRAYELHRCERCLSPTHSVTACLAKLACVYCRCTGRMAEMTKHHTAFCMYQFEK
ncbi:hypothetical protein Y032_0426g1255 [Ancylostoma ceylanicum]|uniref:Uncharacterized protein n=1 Tax=Ancylostoma ceylanicum TaxID=53326 RepID=A0A016X0V3_9BILA|nr:hypothetical protein Y032_0426g1255 [Ancylostoma ceylanicum]